MSNLWAALRSDLDELKKHSLTFDKEELRVQAEEAYSRGDVTSCKNLVERIIKSGFE